MVIGATGNELPALSKQNQFCSSIAAQCSRLQRILAALFVADANCLVDP